MDNFITKANEPSFELCYHVRECCTSAERSAWHFYETVAYCRDPIRAMRSERSDDKEGDR